MIAQLTGKPIIQGDALIIDVGGVGYSVHTTPQTLAKLNGQTQVTLSIYTHIREDAFELFGFLDINDKKLFQLLLSVSGVGPKTAMAITSLGASSITTAVQQADVAAFAKIPRVGRKLAQKIIIELKTKLGSLQELELGGIRDPRQQDVVDALLALGFDDQTVYRLANQLDLSQPTENLIKQALKLTNRRE